MERKLITKTDVLLISCLLAVIAVFCSVRFLVYKTETLIGEVYFDGELVDTVNLTEKEEKKIITGEDNNVVIAAHDGKIFFEKSTCHDKICMLSDELEKSGDFSACLPEKVIVKVVGEKNDDAPDAIVY